MLDATAEPARTPSSTHPKNWGRSRAKEAGRAGATTSASTEPLPAPLDAEQILMVLTALKKGDFSVRLPVTWTGTAGRVADAFNDVAEMLSSTTDDLSRVCHVVGMEGKINERLSTGHVSGGWSERVDSVNTLISCLVHPISETARVIGAVGKGDLSQTMALDIENRPLEGEFLRTAKTVNRMVDQLGAFASEVTRD